MSLRLPRWRKTCPMVMPSVPAIHNNRRNVHHGGQRLAIGGGGAFDPGGDAGIEPAFGGQQFAREQGVFVEPAAQLREICRPAFAAQRTGQCSGWACADAPAAAMPRTGARSRFPGSLGAFGVATPVPLFSSAVASFSGSIIISVMACSTRGANFLFAWRRIAFAIMPSRVRVCGSPVVKRRLPNLAVFGCVLLVATGVG